MTPDPSDCAVLRPEGLPPSPKKTAKDRVFEKGIGGQTLDARGEDVDDRRLRLLDHRGEGKHRVGAGLRHDPVLRRGGGLRKDFNLCVGPKQDSACGANQRGNQGNTQIYSHSSSIVNGARSSGAKSGLSPRLAAANQYSHEWKCA